MPRRPRLDEPGAWHHVMNRGVAKRVIFAKRVEFRFFLALLADVVRRGWMEVHAFSLLPNHFHLLVRSPEGRLSEGMHRIQELYSRWFNRRNRRDGPLFRGRFRSLRVRSEDYWRVLVRYIDHNAVEAGLVQRARDYPYSSAWHYARAKGPPWLSRYEVEGRICAAQGPESRTAGGYDEIFPSSPAPEICALLHRRIGSDEVGGDPFDDLVRAAPSQIWTWMSRKATLADGCAPAFTLLPPPIVMELVAASDSMHDRQSPGWRRSLECGLLRLVCGLTFREISERTGCSTAAAHSRCREHARRIACEPGYAQSASSIVELAFRATFPSLPPKPLAAYAPVERMGSPG
ncbi:MAG TPA: transposase [Thermoanaerobaculia bacterium]|nr:transposase [Thermoanaerobaculia bacterium]